MSQNSDLRRRRRKQKKAKKAAFEQAAQRKRRAEEAEIQRLGGEPEPDIRYPGFRPGKVPDHLLKRVEESDEDDEGEVDESLFETGRG